MTGIVSPCDKKSNGHLEKSCKNFADYRN